MGFTAPVRAYEGTAAQLPAPGLPDAKPPRRKNASTRSAGERVDG